MTRWWQFQMRGWKKFDHQTALQLDHHYVNGPKQFQYNVLGQTLLDFDLEKMTQTNTQSGRERPIRFVEHHKTRNMSMASMADSQPPDADQDDDDASAPMGDTQMPESQLLRPQGPFRSPVHDYVTWVCGDGDGRKLGPLTSKRLEYEWLNRRPNIVILLSGHEHDLDTKMWTLTNRKTRAVTPIRRNVDRTSVPAGYEWQYRKLRGQNVKPFEQAIAEMLETALQHNLPSIHYTRHRQLRECNMSRMQEEVPDRDEICVVMRTQLYTRVPSDILWEYEEVLHSGQWKPCSDSASRYLEAAFNQKIKSTLTLNSESYVVDVTGDPMCQTNNRTGITQHLRRSQRIVDLSTLAPFPSYWDDKATLDSSGVFALCNLPSTDPEYQRVAAAFHRTASQHRIVSIEAYQNKTMWINYHLHKQQMDRRLQSTFAPGANEQWVFHGTQETHIKNICTLGFLRDFNTRSACGFGTYFATDANTSVGYTSPGPNGTRVMFFVRILAGEPCIGASGKRPDKKPSGEYYDCMVNNLQTPTVYVLSFDSDNSAFPAFLIRFQ
eukprot:c1527_g1_i1.p1 GENE.c1527_g1_i1~~c1527_g1_i1.p1  ORF type:complete len:551 (+),score=95.23 c1527_g1_i1:46-1698(+)